MDERTLSSTRPYRGRRINVRLDDVERADGHRTTREIVEHPGAVAIVAWDGDRVAMVRQWRHATGRTLLEIPLTLGVVGAVLAPVWAALGALAALAVDLRIVVEKTEKA